MAVAFNTLISSGSGFLSDEERFTVLERIKNLDPALENYVFDINGDGKVSIEEQDFGRHPLSQLISRSAVEGGTDIQWTPDLFPEWLMYYIVPEDASTGIVKEMPVRGILNNLETTAPDESHAPERIADGLFFNTGSHLTFPRERNARWRFRWGALLFRLDGESPGNTTLLDVNSGRGSSRSSPKITYSQEVGLTVQFTGLANGLDVRQASTKDVIADGTTWNFLVFGMRQGSLFASINGRAFKSETPESGRFSTTLVNELDATTYIGSGDGDSWTLNALLLGQTEPSEAMVRKLEGWAARRLNSVHLLPAQHLYKTKSPVLDLEDLPHRYTHDPIIWQKWLQDIKNKEIIRINSGGERFVPSGYEQVFFDDFNDFRISPSTSGVGDLWMAPGWNTAVGGSAQIMLPDRKPNVYGHDSDKGLQTLSLVKSDDRYFASGICSINDLGQGYSWAGPKIFRIRCMFPKHNSGEIPGGLFPAFWSYGSEFLYWRTSNRIECDFFEFDGIGPSYLNGLSTHIHYPHVKSSFVMSTNSYTRGKGFGGKLDEQVTGIPGGLEIWDGIFHTWEFILDDEITYINVSYPDPDDDKKEKWIEIFRMPTSPTYLERLYLLADYALKANQGVPEQREDFIIDWIEVCQKTENIQKVPDIFTARPEISGTPSAGHTLTCSAQASGITDFRYYWFADNYPLTYGASSELAVTEELAGRTVRCMVKAVGARDMPEAWSAAVNIADKDISTTAITLK